MKKYISNLFEQTIIIYKIIVLLYLHKVTNWKHFKSKVVSIGFIFFNIVQTN